MGTNHLINLLVAASHRALPANAFRRRETYFANLAREEVQ